MASLRELTNEEITLIPSHRQLWHEITFSTNKLDYNQVQEVIQSIYKILKLEIPKIHFCNNLDTLIKESKVFFQQPCFCQDGSILPSREMAQIHELPMNFFDSIGSWDMALKSQLSWIDRQGIELSISRYLCQEILDNLPMGFNGYERNTFWVFPRMWHTDEASLYDFHFSTIQRTLCKPYDEITWQVYRQLIELSIWFTAFDSDCFVCERPQAFLFNRDNTFLSSILFVDGKELVFTESEMSLDEFSSY
jgi:hypothetical protein